MTDTTREEWLAERRNGVGSADIAALLNLSRWDSPYSMWAEKTGVVPARDDTPRKAMGRRMEPTLARWFEEDTGLYVAGAQTHCVHPEVSWMRCTVDDFVFEHPVGPEVPFENYADAIGVLELKTDARFGWPDGVPLYYEAQVQWQLAVTGLPRAWLYVGFSGWRDPELFEIERDDADIAKMIHLATDFWCGHVLTGIPPEVDDSEATTRAIAAQYPTPNEGEAVDLSHLASHFKDREVLKGNLKRDEATLAQIENEIRAAFGTAEVALIDGEPAYSYKAQTRKGIDAKQLEARHPEILEEVRTYTTFRTLRPVTAKKGPST